MKYSATQYAKAFRQLMSEVSAPKRRETVRDFLSTVGKNSSLSLLPDIIRECELLADHEAGIREVTVRTPERMSELSVTRKLPFKARVKAQMDVRLKGGAVVEVEDLRIDNSVAMRLERIRQAFTK